MSKQLSTHVDIQATPARVWEVLSDLAAYPEWNPFIPRIDGEIRPGARLEVRIQPPGAKGMTFRPTVLKAEPNRELRWRGRLWLPGLFDGEHAFTIEPSAANRVRFIQSETFTGLLVPFFTGTLKATLRGFEDMNHALKRRVEQAAVPEE